MSYHPEWASRSPFPAHPAVPSTSDFERKVALAAILLLFGALVLSLLDSWPSTTKRLIWETLVFLTPARLAYAIEYAMVRYKRMPGEEPKFQPEHFGDHQAKAEAIQRILRLDDGQLTNTFRRVRAFSGINNMIGRIQPSHPPGLGNWDNSCYQNSVLQGLASLPAFRTFISLSLERMGQQDEASTHSSLQDLMGRLISTENDAGTLWTPSVLKSMDSWQQQDAQEYFSKLMDTLDKEISKSVKRTKLKLGFEAAALTPGPPLEKTLPLSNPLEGLLAQRVACKKCGHAEGLSLLPFNCLTVNMGRQHEYDLEELLDQHTALEDIEGVECIKCTLLRARSQLGQLLVKTAASGMPDESTEASKISDIAEARLAAIQKVFDDDSFSENGILKRCSIPAKNQVSSVKSKQVVLARPPKILVIHINRSLFDDFGNQRKNTANVRFPPVLNISRWCLGVKSSSAENHEFEQWSMASTKSMLPLAEAELLNIPTSYELRCVVTHYGRHENGHYVAYGKRQSRLSQTTSGPDPAKHDAMAEQWYCFNDEVVTTVPEDGVLDRGNAFMLFYETMEGPSLSQSCSTRANQTSVEAHKKTARCDVTGGTEEHRLIPEKRRENDVLDGDYEGSSAELMLGAIEDSNEHSETGLSQSCVASEKAPSPAPGSVLMDKPPTASGSRPLMRTSGLSPMLSRTERCESSFTMSSSSIISAI